MAGEITSRAGFAVFLKNVARSSPTLLDGHVRPQFYNLHYPALNYDAIFCLERIGDLQPYLARLEPRFAMATHVEHATNASDRAREYFCGETIALVREAYAGDFELFGYSRDLADMAEPPKDGPVNQRPEVTTTSRMAAERDTELARVARYRRLIDLRII